MLTVTFQLCSDTKGVVHKLKCTNYRSFCLTSVGEMQIYLVGEILFVQPKLFFVDNMSTIKRT